MFVSTRSTPDPLAELTVRQRWAYALPALAMALPTLPFYVLLPVYYAEHTSLSLAEVGMWLLLARLIDLASDLYAARACDRPLGRWGRRGWLLLGSLLLAPGLVGLSQPPGDAGAIWLLGFSALLYTGWTLVQVPYTAWLASLTHDDGQRVRLSSHRELLAVVGLVLSAGWPALGGWLGWPMGQSLLYLALLALLWGGISLVWMVIQLPPPEQSGLVNQLAEWRSCYRIRAQRRLLLVWWLNGLANAIAAVLFPLIISDWLGLEEAYRGYLLLAYFISALFGFGLWRWLGQRYNLCRTWALAMLSAVFGFAALPVLPAQLGIYLPVVLITGASLGADMALPHSIQAQLVRWEQHRFGRYQPALHFAAASLVVKLGLGMGVALAPALLSLSGWQDSGPQPDAALMALVVIYSWLPCVLKGIAVALIWHWQQLLDQRPIDINPELSQHHEPHCPNWRPDSAAGR